ncbi:MULTISPECIES: hypothetical protein [Bacillus cereus group]|uniref:Uncharacterized protein n=2 Tax=Bacillus cereus group TaxID=86661 RepID=A0A9X6YT73_BACCE|nr:MULTISPECIES: hypothetical protein [Bacillus cereus group]OUB58711.1 hypothetical protein BK716_04860 [Bacillus thuringiensis serovar higo]PEQ87811.1 hypothetical protein CN475_11945 [Bacillus cereus]
MNEMMLSITKGTQIKVLYDGKSAFIFKQSPLGASLIGALPLALCILIKKFGTIKVNEVRKMLIKSSKFESLEEELKFDNAVLCAIGQLHEQKLIDLS